MGARGPKPKDSRLKALEGNPGKRELTTPIPATGNLKQPGWLARDEYAAEVWDEVVDSMPPNFFKRADIQTLAAYCEACAMMRRAVVDIVEEGIICFTEKGKQKNPAVGVLEGAQAKIAILGTRLSIDLAARSDGGDPIKKGKGKFDGLIGLNGGKN